MGKLTWKTAKIHLDFSFFLFSSFTMTIILKFPFSPFSSAEVCSKGEVWGLLLPDQFLGRGLQVHSATCLGIIPTCPGWQKHKGAWGCGGLSAQPWFDCHDQGPSLRLAQPRHHSDIQECVLKGCTMNFCLLLFWQLLIQLLMPPSAHGSGSREGRAVCILLDTGMGFLSCTFQCLLDI